MFKKLFSSRSGKILTGVVILGIIAFVVIISQRTSNSWNGIAAPKLLKDADHTSARYSCDENKKIFASYIPGKDRTLDDGTVVLGGAIALELSDGRKSLLPQTESASGMQFGNGYVGFTDHVKHKDIFVFWTDNNTAYIEERATEDAPLIQTFRNCVKY
jgi:membrane-bound inhibitor of C-type lysozyme